MDEDDFLSMTLMDRYVHSYLICLERASRWLTSGFEMNGTEGKVDWNVAVIWAIIRSLSHT